MNSIHTKDAMIKIITDKEDELFRHFEEARNKEMPGEVIAETWHDFQIIASLIVKLGIER